MSKGFSGFNTFTPTFFVLNSLPLLTLNKQTIIIIMQEIMNFLLANGAELLLAILAVARIVVRITPSITDNKVFGYLDDLIAFFIKNNDSKKK